MERDDLLERKLNYLQGSGGRQGRDFKDSVAAFRRLADCYPQALYSAGIDPNELEIALFNAMVDGGVSGQWRAMRGMPHRSNIWWWRIPVWICCQKEIEE